MLPTPLVICKPLVMSGIPCVNGLPRFYEAVQSLTRIDRHLACRTEVQICKAFLWQNFVSFRAADRMMIDVTD